jgi:hypothetical protein
MRARAFFRRVPRSKPLVRFLPQSDFSLLRSFMEDVQRIAAQDYRPTVDDILKIYEQTHITQEHPLTVDGLEFVSFLSLFISADSSY